MSALNDVRYCWPTMNKHREPQGIGVERLRAIQGEHRGGVTRLTKQIDDLLAVELVGESIAKLSVLLQQLNNKFDKLQVIDHDIMNVCKLKEIERELEESEVTTAKVLDYKTGQRSPVLDHSHKKPYNGSRTSSINCNCKW